LILILLRSIVSINNRVGRFLDYLAFPAIDTGGENILVDTEARRGDMEGLKKSH
jgi:hypothetical protein